MIWVSSASIAISLYLIATRPSDFPRWWQPRPSREACYRGEVREDGRIGRCVCGTHRGEASIRS